MARHRRLRTALVVMTAVTACWLTVLGTATAAPATPAGNGADRPTGQTGQMGEVASPQVAVPVGTYQIRPYLSRDECLRAGPQAGDTGIYVGACGDSTSLWRLGPTAPAHGAQFMEVRNLSNNMCLDEYHPSGATTGRVDFLQCSQRADQAWDFRGGTAAQSWVCVASSPDCDLVLRMNSTFTSWGGRNVYTSRITNDTSLGDRRWQLLRVS
ncbi:RICIN domain-containing protein [Streptomyces daliensis]